MRKSNDKATPSHIERTVYVSRNVRPGDTVRYGNWSDNPRDYYLDSGGPPADLQLTIIEAATGSDYSGNLVEISNARSLKRDFPWLVEVYGGYSTLGVAYLGKRENQNDRLIEAIDALASYPIYDEQDHSDLEMETVDAQWSESYGGRHDFKRALCKMWALDDREYDEDRLTDDSLVDQLWYDCCELMRGGESYLNESGSSIYFPVDRVIADIRADRRDLYRATYSSDNRPIIEKLEELRMMALVPDEQTAST